MLSWLTGTGNVDDAAGFDTFLEPPETPAPVFAVRAFKHALFGTPQTVQAPKVEEPRPTTATDTTQETATLTKTRTTTLKTVSDETIISSPSKPNGILMTPGTTRRSKSVSFGAQVVDNGGKEGKRTSKSSSSKIVPGNWPATPKIDLDHISEIALGSRTRTNLTTTFQEVRNSSQKARLGEAPRAKDDVDITLDLMEPRSHAGRYWKQEYDSYAEKTQREMMKLVIKQKSAKSYAKEKDAEVVELSEQLRQERRKVEKLAARTEELAAQMKEYHIQLASTASKAQPTDLTAAYKEIAKLRSDNERLRKQIEGPNARKKQDSTPRTTESLHMLSKSPGNVPDFWADIVSSPLTSKSTTQSPLRKRDINTLDVISTPTTTAKPSKSPKRTPRSTSRHTRTPPSSKTISILPDASLDLSLPQPSPDLAARTTPRSAARKSLVDQTIDELVEKYSPVKYDKLALPLGMPSTPFSFEMQAQNVVTSLQKASSVAAEEVLSTGAENEAPKKAVNLSEERRLKAEARLAAKREARAAAAA